MNELYSLEETKMISSLDLAELNLHSSFLVAICRRFNNFCIWKYYRFISEEKIVLSELIMPSLFYNACIYILNIILIGTLTVWIPLDLGFIKRNYIVLLKSPENVNFKHCYYCFFKCVLKFLTWVSLQIYRWHIYAYYCDIGEDLVWYHHIFLLFSLILFFS